MPKQYPIEIESTGDDGWFSKGHHDPAQFCADAERYWGYRFHPQDVTHEWWRCVPDSTGEYTYLYWPAKPHSRGAFPVTVCLRERRG